MQTIFLPSRSSPLFIGPDAPWLAPLAGFSDLPFRLLCREGGAAVACTEMVSAKGLIYSLREKSRKNSGLNRTEDLLRTTPEDAPLVVQLFGDEPEFVAQAVRVLQERGYVFFDLNMGCSVPKVCKTGAGAALLRAPQRALAVARAMLDAVHAGGGRAGCKIRLGWDATEPVYLALAKALQDAGADWITLHPRYARQAFSGKVDCSALEKLAKTVCIPVIASGDLLRAEDGIARLELGVAGVMFARGAMADPAVFGRYAALLQGVAPPGHFEEPQHLLRLVLRHASLAQRYMSPEGSGRRKLDPALLKMRTVVPRYVRHLPGAKKLRLALTRCESWQQMEAVLHAFFAEGQESAPATCCCFQNTLEHPGFSGDRLGRPAPLR